MSYTRLVWIAPFALHAADACAWGLYTHTYFAQLLLWAIPVADPRFRRALARCPGLFLAATCLPDVALFSRALRAPGLGTTHRWPAAIAMLGEAESDADRAMSLGFATHLLTDIVAHHYFVPAHEQMWFRLGMVTHASAEWAMDAHVSTHLFARPAALIARHRETLAAFAHEGLGLERSNARRGLTCLMRGEGFLRRARIPQLVYRAGRCVDGALRARLDHYVHETGERLRQIDRLVAGETPRWLPEADSGARAGQADEPLHHPYLAFLPSDFFRDVRSR